MTFSKKFPTLAVNNEYPLNNLVKLLKQGFFDNFSTDIVMDMGGYDCFCDDKVFFNKIHKELIKKISPLTKSNKINGDNTYVLFNEICPCVGPRYCDFRICDIITGEVLYCFCHIKKGCYGEDFSGWELWDFTDPSHTQQKSTIRGSWNDIKHYFNI